MRDFEAFAGVSMKVAVCQVVMKCDVIEIYGRFKKKKITASIPFILIIQVICSVEMWV